MSLLHTSPPPPASTHGSRLQGAPSSAGRLWSWKTPLRHPVPYPESARCSGSVYRPCAGSAQKCLSAALTDGVEAHRPVWSDKDWGDSPFGLHWLRLTCQLTGAPCNALNHRPAVQCIGRAISSKSHIITSFYSCIFMSQQLHSIVHKCFKFAIYQSYRERLKGAAATKQRLGWTFCL